MAQAGRLLGGRSAFMHLEQIQLQPAAASCSFVERSSSPRAPRVAIWARRRDRQLWLSVLRRPAHQCLVHEAPEAQAAPARSSSNARRSGQSWQPACFWRLVSRTLCQCKSKSPARLVLRRTRTSLAALGPLAATQGRHLTIPSSGRAKGRFAPLAPPLMSNVGPQRGEFRSL